MANSKIAHGKVVEISKRAIKDPIELQKNINVVAMKAAIEKSVKWLERILKK